MKREFLQIYDFHCPRWEEIPEKGLFNQEVVNYIAEILRPVMWEEFPITATMIQNYTKLGFLPKREGRKYNRVQVAYLIVIAVYKQVLNIGEVKQGVELQLELMQVDKAYDTFAQSFEKALKSVFGYMVEEDRTCMGGFEVHEEELGVESIANAFAFKLLGRMILRQQGFKNLDKYQQ
ncbi:MAG: DUF1836 domain-containing protein [Peptoniphilus sp.]|nr:DUF1836 domain-containing protein [Peptoniphilus sp.]